MSLKLKSCVVCVLLPLLAPIQTDAREVDFVRDVQPIFADRCYECHGPEKQESSLRLDSKEIVFRGGRHGPAILPGDSADSILIQVLTGAHEEIKPMPKKGEPLSDGQIQLLREWIDQGAEWPDSASVRVEKQPVHWAFQAPRRPPLPNVKNNQWGETPIDAFVEARLEKEGLQPSPEARKTTLLRRLFLDLIGLPPSPQEIAAFLEDDSPDAYQKQVERLLASPHYGERWGRHWLDAARYADSDGFEKDKQRFVWFYRDYVINAFNRDLPYDRFIIEQIAGDLLPDATQDQKVATGFLRNSMINEEGGVHPEQFRMEAMFDRMDAIGKGILGLTIQCAQCHDHKYDPMSQEEYYNMFAFINDSHEGSIVVYTPEQQTRRADIFRKINEIENDLKRQTPDWRERMTAWEASVRDNQPEWMVLAIDNAGDNAQRYYKRPDRSLVAAGYAPTKFTGVFTNTVHLDAIRAFRLEVLPDGDLPANGPGRSVDGLFGLTEFKVEVASVKDPSMKSLVKFEKATADFGNERLPLDPRYDDRSGKERVTGPIEYAIDDDDLTAWGIDAGPGRRNVARKAVFLAKTNVAYAGGTKLTFRLRQMHGGWNSDDNQNMNLGRFRISVTGAENATADPIPGNVRKILSIPRDERGPEQIAEVFSYWRTTAPEWKEANQRIEELWKTHPEGVTQLVLTTRDEPRETHFLQRGDFLKPAQAVQPGVPAFLHSLPQDAPLNRLTFARWLVDRRSPTTARALINRIWQAYFGIGLVETSEDLGVQAPPRSHPDLLDWLAVEFMEPKTRAFPSEKLTPWSIKHIHRLIVHSAAYRQSSRVSRDLYKKDPYNRLLARGPRFRVEAEIVRDIALSASGLLNPKVGGPSVYPAAPAFLFEPPVSFGPKVWDEATGPDRYRRAIYTFRYRSVPYPVLEAFDAPKGESSCVRRARSNTPLQALTTLNEPIFMECAQALAARTLTEAGANDRDRVNYAFQLCLSRMPNEQEAGELLSLLEKQKSHLAEGWVNTRELAGLREQEPPPGVTPTELAAWTAVSRVLLNLDETITKE